MGIWIRHHAITTTVVGLDLQNSAEILCHWSTPMIPLCIGWGYKPTESSESLWTRPLGLSFVVPALKICSIPKFFYGYGGPSHVDWINFTIGINTSSPPKFLTLATARAHRDRTLRDHYCFVDGDVELHNAESTGGFICYCCSWECKPFSSDRTEAMRRPMRQVQSCSGGRGRQHVTLPGLLPPHGDGGGDAWCK